MQAYDHETIRAQDLPSWEINIWHPGTYRVEYIYDDCADAPWDNCTPYADVSDWERRDKAPGELILSEDRGSRRFYNFAAAVRNVRGQGISGPDAAKYARQEYEYFRAWCRDEWHYIGVRVVLLDDEGEETSVEAALWGVESDARDYIKNDVIPDLVRECEWQLEKLAAPYAPFMPA